MIKLKTLVESDCNCGDSCCATNESINENVGDLKKIVKEFNDRPDDLAKILAERYGIDYVE